MSYPHGKHAPRDAEPLTPGLMNEKITQCDICIAEIGTKGILAVKIIEYSSRRMFSEISSPDARDSQTAYFPAPHIPSVV